MYQQTGGGAHDGGVPAPRTLNRGPSLGDGTQQAKTRTIKYGKGGSPFERWAG